MKKRMSKQPVMDLKECGDVFLGHILDVMHRPGAALAAENLSNLLTWAEGAPAFVKDVSRARLDPFQVLAMGIVVGKRGSKFPFTSAKDLAFYAKDA